MRTLAVFYENCKANGQFWINLQFWFLWQNTQFSMKTARRKHKAVCSHLDLSKNSDLLCGQGLKLPAKMSFCEKLFYKAFDVAYKDGFGASFGGKNAVKAKALRRLYALLKPAYRADFACKAYFASKSG